MDSRNLLSLAGGLLILGAAGYYWGMGSSISPQPITDARQPDYVVQEIQGRESDAQGRLWRQLQARELRHYAQTPDRAELDAPQLTLYQDGQPLWQIRARQGIGRDQAHEILLQGQVQAERQLPGQPPLRLQTEALTAYTPQQRLHTDRTVIVQGPQGRLQAQGLTANLKTGDIILSQHVQGHYVPPSPPRPH